MTSTAQSICARALRLINAIGVEQTPSDAQYNTAYQTLREMVDAWAADRLSILVVERATFSLVSGTQSYTIGTGGTFNRNRPIWLPAASIIVDSSATNPLELPIQVLSFDEWQRVPVKSIQSGLPTAVYYDHAYSTSGLGVLYFFPVPNASNIQAVLYCPTPLTQFSSLTASYDFPPAYLRAITFNLALDISPYFDIQPTPLVVQRAAEYLGDIRRANIQPYTVMVDSALVSQGDRFNYYTGFSA